MTTHPLLYSLTGLDTPNVVEVCASSDGDVTVRWGDTHTGAPHAIFVNGIPTRGHVTMTPSTHRPSGWALRSTTIYRTDKKLPWTDATDNQKTKLFRSIERLVADLGPETTRILERRRRESTLNAARSKVDGCRLSLEEAITELRVAEAAYLELS